MRRWKRALELLCQTRKRALATAGVVRDGTLNQVGAANPDCRSPTETETRMPASATSSSANVTEGRASTVVKVECLLS